MSLDDENENDISFVWVIKSEIISLYYENHEPPLDRILFVHQIGLLFIKLNEDQRKDTQILFALFKLQIFLLFIKK